MGLGEEFYNITNPILLELLDDIASSVGADSVAKAKIGSLIGRAQMRCADQINERLGAE